VRIAPKTVTTSPSTTDTSGISKPSGGGSFLDILFQGTQEASSKEPSAAQSTQAGSAPATTTPKQSDAQAPNTSGNQQSAQSAAGTSQVRTVQNLPSVLALANLTAADGDPASSTAAAQTATSSTQAPPSGKPAATAKGIQAKHAAATTAGADANALQQAAAILQTANVPAPTPLPTLPQQVLPSTLAPIASQLASTGATGEGNSQATSQSGTAPSNASGAAASGPLALADAANAPTQQDTSGPTSVSNPQFLHDLAAIAANALKTDAAAVTPAGTSTQASPTKSTQGSDQAGPTQTVPSTFFAAAIAPNDNIATQTVSKAIPFRVGATNLGANANSTGVTAVGSNSAPGTNTVSATPAKNTAQDSSNQSSRDGQPGNDAALRSQTDTMQTANAAVHPDASALPFTLSAATAHAAAQTASSSPTTGATPSHVSDGRNLPSEPANSPLPAAGSAINTARVIQNMNETEMRVGMRSTEFGDISIRTMVTQQQMQTQISVDHSELVSALTAHIPSVQAKLGADYGLHASIEVSQGGASFSNNQGQSSQKDYKPFTPSTQIDGTAPLAETDRMFTRPVTAVAPLMEGSRLDIRA
jgi:hypothetical protein